MATSPSKVIIIGAGTGGLCLAQGLKRAGIGVGVYERDRTRADGLQGYRVGIDADGKRALRANLPPELYQTFLATCAQRPVYANQLTHQMKFLFSAGPELLKDGDQPPEADRDESVSRMTLRQVLLTGVEDVVHFDKVFSHYEQHPDATVTAFFQDGTSATGDLLVAADGANSRVRRQYLPQARLADTGLIGITGKTLLTPQTRALLPQRMIQGVSMVHGPKGFMCIVHVMQFKWDRAGELKGGIGGTDAIGAYETTMTGYAWDAVIKSRAQMDGHSTMHKAGPLGGLARAGMRTGMRVMNHLPAVKRKLVTSESSFRGAGRDQQD